MFLIFLFSGLTQGVPLYSYTSHASVLRDVPYLGHSLIFPSLFFTNLLQLPFIELSPFRLNRNRNLNRKKPLLIFIRGYNNVFPVCQLFPSKVANLLVVDATGMCFFALYSVSGIFSYITHKTVVIWAYLSSLWSPEPLCSAGELYLFLRNVHSNSVDMQMNTCRAGWWELT